jgi:hypothetical protein
VDVFPTLLLALLFIAAGVIMIANNMVAVGINSRTLQRSGLGGGLLIFVGLIFLVVTYYSFSPFSKFRNLFGKKRERPKIEKDNEQMNQWRHILDVNIPTV